ncbi:helix-turn-helix domain-containing protein [Bacillus thuringiensis]|uniref:Helix-turn-helix transcriptional regulator n=1 Tax=Bacillus cereus TaxID=1396 RepID=A0AAN6B6W4_BACCE|nr:MULTISPECIES: helix-turn-helix transcriptional regulator [Bacillus cereus group]KAB2448969.1 helix-turn-helix transcriptional regulator [Bacillus cereus]KAB2482313.1 helix-turn-helix transcriptional regulator [Bacillus cereus]MCU5454755.1 helix-turn-helix domain-containing protein [Bacillus cereus]MCU5485151.1 helix-turn-helix domain-containing protein [Bacillus cereus]MCU5548966.1 helix-turn-helix domain-containing protein [Bacillus cereus]
MSNFNGEKLTELRHLFGMAQGQVAELLDVDIDKLIEIERSRIIPTFNQIQVLCRTFHVKSKYFYSESFVTNRVNPNYISFRH